MLTLNLLAEVEADLELLILLSPPVTRECSTGTSQHLFHVLLGIKPRSTCAGLVLRQFSSDSSLVFNTVTGPYNCSVNDNHFILSIEYFLDQRCHLSIRFPERAQVLPCSLDHESHVVTLARTR